MAPEPTQWNLPSAGGDRGEASNVGRQNLPVCSLVADTKRKTMLSICLAVSGFNMIQTPAATPRSAAAATFTRRQVATTILPAAAVSFSALPALAADEKDSIPYYFKKAITLRTFTVTAAKTGVPMEARVGRVQRYTAKVLNPLLEKMSAEAPTLGLPEDKQKRAEELPALLKAEFKELEEAVAKEQFDDFEVSGRKFAGGKVEAELLDVVDTVEEYVKLRKLAGRA